MGTIGWNLSLGTSALEAGVNHGTGLLSKFEAATGSAGGGLERFSRTAENTHGPVSKLSSLVQTATGTMAGMVASTYVTQGLGMAMGALQSSVIGMNATLETSELQFKSLGLTGAEAKQHVADLFQFAKVTPFETGPIIAASRQLEVFGGKALDTNANLTLFGDTAAATNAPLQDLTFWVGRFFSAAASGQTLGEPIQNLQQLGVLSPEVTAKLQNMSQAQIKSGDAWKLLTTDLHRFNGAMAAQAGTWQGLTSSLSDALNITSAQVLKPFFTLAEGGVSKLLDLVGSPEVAAAATSFSTSLATGFEKVGTVVGSSLGAAQQAMTKTGDVGVAMSAGFVSLGSQIGIPTPILMALNTALVNAYGIFQDVKGAVTSFVTEAIQKLGPPLKDIGATLLTDVLPPITAMATSILPAFSSGTGKAADQTNLLHPALDVAKTALVALKGPLQDAGAVIRWLSEHGEMTRAAIFGIAAGYAAWNVVLAYNNTMLAINAALTGGGGLVGFAVRLVAVTVAMGPLVAITALWNLLMMINPIVLIVVGIALLIAGIVLLVTHWSQVTAAVAFLWSRFVAFGGWLAGEFVGIWNRLPGPVQGALLMITAPIRGLITLGTLVVSHWGQVTSFLSAAFGLIGRILVTAFAIWLGIVLTVSAAIWGAISSYWSFVLVFLTAAWAWIVARADEVWNSGVAGTIRAAVSAVSVWLQGTWAGIVDWLSGIWALLGAIANEKFAGVFGTISGWMVGVRDFVGGIWQGMVAAADWAAGQLWDKIKGGLNTAIGWANEFIHKANDFVGHFGVASIPDIPKLAQGGLVSSPTVALVGEAGPEMVIPLGGGRGLELWQQAGGLLGMQQMGAAGTPGMSPGEWGGQCVVAVENWLGVFWPVAAAAQLAAYVNSNTAKPGEAAVFTGGPFGHVALVTGPGDGYSFPVIDSNWVAPETIGVHTMNRGMYGFAGFIDTGKGLPGFIAQVAGISLKGLADQAMAGIAGQITGTDFGSQMARGLVHTAGEAVKGALPFDEGGVLPAGYSVAYNGTGGPEALVRADRLGGDDHLAAIRESMRSLERKLMGSITIHNHGDQLDERKLLERASWGAYTGQV